MGSENQTPRVSAVIVNYNTRELLDRCLRALAACAHSFGLEVIVVDNGSTDRSVEMIKANHPGVRLIRNPINCYFAAAANKGAAASSGDKILFLNSDVQVAFDALDLLLRPQDSRVAAVVPLLRSADGDPQREYTFRRLPTTRDIVLSLLFSRRLGRFIPWLSRWDDQETPIDRDCDVQQPSAACILMNAKVFRDLGGFDESFALWFNDVDLCKRFAYLGYRIRYLHDVAATHVGGATVQRLTEVERTQRLYADTIAYVRKWHQRSLSLVGAAVVVNFLVRSAAKLLEPDKVRVWVRSTRALLAPLTSNRC